LSSPWEELRGQILLGEADFVDAHKDLLHDKKTVKELSRNQRYVNRPRLSSLFSKSRKKTQRDQTIHRAYIQHGYTMKSIADHLGIHYTTVSRVIEAQEES
jgi:DNA-binding MarR family transcriptional regulator